MAVQKNVVLAGDYQGKFVIQVKKVYGSGIVAISTGFLKQIELNNSTVAQYELITEETRVSAASGVARGIVGGALLGPIGMLAGAASAKSKGIHQVAVAFHDGKKSLIAMDDKVYNMFIRNCF